MQNMGEMKKSSFILLSLIFKNNFQNKTRNNSWLLYFLEVHFQKGKMNTELQNSYQVKEKSIFIISNYDHRSLSDICKKAEKEFCWLYF